jgi:DeoR/GlpR family transcriptional regulator of sugar metabolism
MNARQLSILNDVSQNAQINVKALAKTYHVSQVTIRNDLKHMESHGVLERFHGGARTVSDDNIMKRLSVNYDIKLKIAKEAATLISDGETVMIESGSSNALLAKELTKKKDITIITNSAFIARYIRSDSNINITLIGGDYQHESEVMVGPLTRLCLSQFNVDKVFIGVDGFSENSGFTCMNLMRSEVAKAMAQQANKVCILTDSGKFEKVGVSSQLMPHEVSIVITDDQIPQKSIDLLEKNNVQLRIIK